MNKTNDDGFGLRAFDRMKSISILFILALLIACVVEAQEKQHPSLVDPSKTRCETCHADKLTGNVHPIVRDGCDSCHNMEKKEDRTVVSLMAIGNELCATCHGDQADRAALDTPHPALESCLNCHSPHNSSNQKLMLEPLPDQCFTCHDRDDLKTSHKEQPVASTNCLSCHDPHGNKQAHFLIGTNQHPPFAEGSCDSCHRKGRGSRVSFQAPQPGLCLACHSDKEDALKKTVVHPPVRDGKCTACHSPHMSNQKKFLKARVPELCFGCHTDIKEAMKTGSVVHPPAQEDCFNCHETHSGNEPHLLQADMMEGGFISTLCANCHELTELKLKHRNADLSQAACTTCHSPHGSHQKHLINAVSVHPPFEEDCGNCHAEGTSLQAEVPDLCYTCHDDIQSQVEKATVPHPAIEFGCTACHSPHASGFPRLFKTSMISTCGECHDDMLARIRASAYVHGAITRVGCQACHTPHGGDREKLLKNNIVDLCLGCHQQGTPEKAPKIILSKDSKRDHPIPKHSVEPKGGSCVSCHDPHSGQSPFLFAGQIQSETQLCATCHPK